MRIPGIVPNTAAEVEWWQHGEIIAACEERRDAWRARFSPPEGCCQYGCDGSGWRETDGPLLEMEIVHDGVHLTPCQCNMAGTSWWGVLYRWPRHYPEGYDGPRVGPPRMERRAQ